MASSVNRHDERLIVGRDRERAQLRELLGDAVAGQGSLVLISGEAGIGKTTLVDDLISEAKERSCLVLTGGCYDLTTTPPYGPWIEALRRYVPGDEEPPLPAWFGNLDELEKVGSQATLFDETERLLRALAGRRPLLIVLEDLHWSDAASLEALRVLSRSLSDAPVLLVVSYRDDELTRRHELSQLLPLLVRESRAKRVHLSRLDRDALTRLIEERFDLTDADTARLASYLQERSEGNPFFANELLQGLEEEQVLRQAGDVWTLADLATAHVPPLLRSVIEGRLRRLSNETRQLLEIAAVIGQRVSFSLWATVSGLDERELIDAVAEGRRAQLIDESPERRGIQFRHALVREALYEAIIGVELRARHRQIGEALAARSNPDPDRVAHHFREAGDDRQIDWLLRAGERAERSYAWSAAVEHYETVVRLLEGDAEQTLERGWLLFRISDIQRYTDPRLSLRYAEEARRIGEEIGDYWLAAYATFRAGFYRTVSRSLGRGFAAPIDEMIAGCEAIDAGLRAYWRGDDEPGWQKSIERVRRQERESVRYLDTTPVADDKPLTMAWGATITRLNATGRLTEASRLAEAMLPVATWALEHVQLTARTMGYADAVYGLATDYARLGKIEPARALFSDALGAYRSYGHHVLAASMLWNTILKIELPFFTDEPGRRRELIAEAATDEERARGSLPSGGLFWQDEARVDLIEGRWSQFRQLAERRLNDERSWAHFQEAALAPLAWLDAMQGNPDQVWQRIEQIHLDGPATEPGDTAFDPATQLQLLAADLALDADRLDDARAWLEAYDRWMVWSGPVLGLAEGQLGWARYHRIAGDQTKARAYAGRALEHASEPRQPLELVAIERFLGQLDVDEGNYDEAEEHLTASLHLAERCEAPFEQALTRLVIAELASKTDNADEAWSQLDLVRAICTPLQAQPALERARAIAATLAGRRGKRVHPAGLTPREVDVLQLVAQGMSDAEAAQELFISPRTVGQHLRSVYNKLGVNSRVDAAVWAVEHGLT